MSSNKENILEVKDLVKHFPIKSGLLQHNSGAVKAVDGISFTIKKGETFGLVGESGCGKTTAGRTILRLTERTSGNVTFKGQDIFAFSKKEMRKIRPQMQLIFQDPYSSLDPKMTVGNIIGEAVKEHNIVPKSEYRDYVIKVMEDCELRPYYIDRFPHEFSGGQRQRICIARSLALNPDLIVADEPVSALDVSIQAQIINMLQDLRRKKDISYLFISHDLSVVEYLSDVVGVMYLGTMVEKAPKKELFKNPMHPYTKALLSAIPIPNPDVKMNRIILEGDIPSPANPPKGCKFHTRCKYCMDICKEETPEFKDFGGEHMCACHLFK